MYVHQATSCKTMLPVTHARGDVAERRQVNVDEGGTTSRKTGAAVCKKVRT